MGTARRESMRVRTRLQPARAPLPKLPCSRCHHSPPCASLENSRRRQGARRRGAREDLTVETPSTCGAPLDLLPAAPAKWPPPLSAPDAPPRPHTQTYIPTNRLRRQGPLERGGGGGRKTSAPLPQRGPEPSKRRKMMQEVCLRVKGASARGSCPAMGGARLVAGRPTQIAGAGRGRWAADGRRPPAAHLPPW